MSLLLNQEIKANSSNKKINSNNNKIKEESLLSYMFNQLNILKVASCLVLILLSGMIINIISIWMFSAYDGITNKYLIVASFFVVAIVFLGIQYITGNELLGKKNFYLFSAITVAFLNFLRVSDRFHNVVDENPHKEHLIIFLSSIFDSQIVTWNEIKFEQNTLKKIYSDRITKDKRHAWEMSLRSIHY